MTSRDDVPADALTTLCPLCNKPYGTDSCHHVHYVEGDRVLMNRAEWVRIVGEFWELRRHADTHERETSPRVSRESMLCGCKDFEPDQEKGEGWCVDCGHGVAYHEQVLRDDVDEVPCWHPLPFPDPCDGCTEAQMQVAALTDAVELVMDEFQAWDDINIEVHFPNPEANALKNLRKVYSEVTSTVSAPSRSEDDDA